MWGLHRPIARDCPVLCSAHGRHTCSGMRHMPRPCPPATFLSTRQRCARVPPMSSPGRASPQSAALWVRWDTLDGVATQGLAPGMYWKGGVGLAGKPLLLESPYGPRRRRAENFEVNPLGTEGGEAKFRLSASNIGRGGGGGSKGGTPPPPAVYGRSNTPLSGPLSRARTLSRAFGGRVSPLCATPPPPPRQRGLMPQPPAPHPKRTPFVTPTEVRQNNRRVALFNVVSPSAPSQAQAMVVIIRGRMVTATRAGAP